MKICDLHTHILPGMDDGANDMETALEMIQNATASDVKVLVLTPHCNRQIFRDNFFSKETGALFSELCNLAKEYPISLALGSEFHVTDDAAEILENNQVLTLNNSRYLLTEFPMHSDNKYIREKLRDIKSLGYIPLVAHPERYSAVCYDPGIVEGWLDMGCHIQLTGGSVVGKYGGAVQQAARFLLQNDFVCCIASDAHDLYSRNNNLLDVHSYLSLYYSRQYADMLLWDNPMAIYHNATL